jgi:hypothetical protein
VLERRGGAIIIGGVTLRIWGAAVGGIVELHLDKAAWSPGEIVTGLMLLQFTKKTKVMAFDAWLYGHENAKVTVRHGKHSTTYRESRPIVEAPLVALETRSALFWPGEYEAGTYTLPFEAPLPHGCPPSFSERRTGFAAESLYHVHVGVGIPWASDPSSNVDVPVVVPPYVPSTAPAMAMKPAGFFTAGTSIELRVDTSDAPRGGLVTGTAMVTTTGTRRMRGVRVRLTERASCIARGHSGGNFARPLAESVFRPGQAAFGVPLPFQLPVPPDARPSYEGQIVFLRHAVTADADMAMAMDPHVESPFRIT